MDAPRLTRHARNNLRLYRVTMDDLMSALARATPIGQDGLGNPRLDARVRGRLIHVVVAGDDPAVVITLFVRRR